MWCIVISDTKAIIPKHRFYSFFFFVCVCARARRNFPLYPPCAKPITNTVCIGLSSVKCRNPVRNYGYLCRKRERGGLKEDRGNGVQVPVYGARHRAALAVTKRKRNTHLREVALAGEELHAKRGVISPWATHSSTKRTVSNRRGARKKGRQKCLGE